MLFVFLLVTNLIWLIEGFEIFFIYFYFFSLFLSFYQNEKLKLDNKVVPREQIELFTQKHELLYFETSAITFQNVEEAINTLALHAVRSLKKTDGIPENLDKVDLQTNTEIQPKDKCCV
jgi:hypothetical protein